MASVTRRPGESRWQARYRGPDGRQVTRRFDRKVDAQRWLDEAAASLVTGQFVDPRAGRESLASFYARWAARQTWTSGTERAMELAVRRCTFSQVPLARVRRSEVETWVRSMVDDDLAPGTIRTRLTNVRSVLRGAVEDQLLARDPSRGVALPRARRREAAMVLPDAGQLRALLGAADEAFAPVVALAAFAGLRLGEIAGLQVADVDFLRRRLEVRRQVQRAPGGEVEVRLPKYGSERDVYLAEDLLAVLARHVECYSPGSQGSRWLFPGNGGKPMHQNSVGAAWRRTAAAAEVTGLTLHSMRHYYASGLIAAGCDVVTVQRALGHAKATVTLTTYAHLWPSAEDRTRAAAGQLMRSVLADPEDAVRTIAAGGALTCDDALS